MKFLSVCSGIEAASLAWNPIGWEAVGFAEIDPFARAVLKHRFPDIQNFGDIRNYGRWKPKPFDLLAGGTPCQAFSVAGLRAGFSDPRGNLAIVFLGIVDRFRPRWIVWENVPGVLSSVSHDAPDSMLSSNPEAEGITFGYYEAQEIHAFNAFVAGLSQLGYGWAFRVLDSQFYGVPQRRRRIFLVGHIGGWTRSAAVLFDPDSLRGNPTARQEAGNACSADVGSSLERHVVPAVTAKWAKGSGGPAGDECQNLVPIAFSWQFAGDTNLGLSLPGVPPVRTNHRGTVAVAFPDPDRGVRKLTPRECERLQGMPDDWTLVPYRGAPATDSPRYRAIGNSWAVPVARKIGERIAFVDQL